MLNINGVISVKIWNQVMLSVCLQENQTLSIYGMSARKQNPARSYGIGWDISGKHAHILKLELGWGSGKQNPCEAPLLNRKYRCFLTTSIKFLVKTR